MSTVSSNSQQAEEVAAVAANTAIVNLAEPTITWQQMQAADENINSAVCSNDIIEVAEMKTNTSSINKRRMTQIKGIKRQRSKSAPRQNFEATEHMNVPKRSTRDRKPKRYDDYDTVIHFVTLLTMKK